MALAFVIATVWAMFRTPFIISTRKPNKLKRMWRAWWIPFVSCTCLFVAATIITAYQN